MNTGSSNWCCSRVNHIEPILSVEEVRTFAHLLLYSLYSNKLFGKQLVESKVPTIRKWNIN